MSKQSHVSDIERVEVGVRVAREMVRENSVTFNHHRVICDRIRCAWVARLVWHETKIA